MIHPAKRPWELADYGFAIAGGSLILGLACMVIFLAMHVSLFLLAMLVPIVGIALIFWSAL